MTVQPKDALRRWFPHQPPAEIASIASPASFSGALLWRVVTEGSEYCLRAWPSDGPNRRQLARIHALQRHLGTVGPRITPVPVPGRAGTTIEVIDGRHWELASWRPGNAESSIEPPRARIESACESLAELHIAAAQCDTAECRRDVSPAMQRRTTRTEQLQAGELKRLRRAAESIGHHGIQSSLIEGLELAATLIPMMLQSLLPMTSRKLPLQWRLTDVRREHVLFTDDRVTGIVDFGAAEIDSPAGDLARLLGELSGNRRAEWAAGLEAYQRVRPLSSKEQTAVRVFDVTGVCLSLCNWAAWVCDESDHVSRLAPELVEVRIQQLLVRILAIDAATMAEIYQRG